MSRFVYKARALYGQVQLYVLSVSERNEWCAILLVAFYTVSWRSAFSLGALQPMARMVLPPDSVSYPQSPQNVLAPNKPPYVWLPCSKLVCLPCQVTSIRAATLSHSWADVKLRSLWMQKIEFVMQARCFCFFYLPWQVVGGLPAALFCFCGKQVNQRLVAKALVFVRWAQHDTAMPQTSHWPENGSFDLVIHCASFLLMVFLLLQLFQFRVRD